jgi:predicted Zn-dependent protease
MRSFARSVRFAGLTVLFCSCSVSTQQEVQMGAQDSAQLNAQLPLVQDAAINQYVNSLGTSIARLTSRSDLPWTFYVVNTSDVNAFALPGGIIYVNRGVLERADKMDELAGVLGHEIEHVVRRHSVKQMEQTQGAQTGVSILCVLTSACGGAAAQEAINVGGTLVFAKMSREDEKQADDGGFQNVMRANISPQGMLTFFQKLLAEYGSGAAGVSGWFADHPGTQDRIADIQGKLSQVPQDKLASMTQDTREFRAIKQRVNALPPAPAPRAPGT